MHRIRLFVVLLLAACGGGRDDESSNTSFTGTCCLNGSYFDCATKAAFDKCAGFDVIACNEACAPSDSTCFEDCSRRAENATHDSSSCTRDSTMDDVCD